VHAGEGKAGMVLFAGKTFPFLYYRFTAQSDNKRILKKTSNMPSGAAVLQIVLPQCTYNLFKVSLSAL